MKSVIIIGGGIAGLITAIQLAHNGIHTTVIERKRYPFHRVCGEYISNEAVPFLRSLDVLPSIELPQINYFKLSNVNGKSAELPLDLGGFGVSRFFFDNFLYQKAHSLGVHFILETSAEEIKLNDETFHVTAGNSTYQSDIVVGAFGKRSMMDVRLGRSFVKKKSPYIAIKYHIKTDFPEHLIALHNFNGGYCGISKVENSVTNLCYLANREVFKPYHTPKEFERAVLCKNPLLRYIFNNSDFIFEKPLVINEVSFETKTPVEQQILMAGDAAGMIAPLCGNGMAMAIHSGKILAESIISYCQGRTMYNEMVEQYRKTWNNNFAKRLLFGRQVQKLFGNPILSNFAVNLGLYVKPIARMLIRHSHGNPF